MPRAKEITQERLKELLNYDPETGLFTYKIKRGHRRSGDLAGNVNSRQYIAIKVDDKTYSGHRLAWFYMTGEWPSEIDHVNGNKADNRFVNFRLADRRQNAQNRPVRNDSRTGLKGVCTRKNNAGFWATICVHGKRIYLGQFDTAEEAHLAYCSAAEKHFGDFARRA